MDYFFPEILCSETIRLFKIKLLDGEDFIELIFRFAINFTFVFIISRTIYYKLYRKDQYLFTYFLVGNVVFFLCFLLENVKLELGFALGLFAIFGILRYRTDAIPIKEMTYLFIVIGISVINALANKKISYIEMGFTNLVICGLTYGIERVWFRKLLTSSTIVISNLDLIKPEKETELISYLKEITGLEIEKVKVGKINVAKNEVQVKYYCSKEF